MKAALAMPREWVERWQGQRMESGGNGGGRREVISLKKWNRIVYGIQYTK